MPQKVVFARQPVQLTQGKLLWLGDHSRHDGNMHFKLSAPGCAACWIGQGSNEVEQVMRRCGELHKKYKLKQLIVYSDPGPAHLRGRLGLVRMKRRRYDITAIAAYFP